MQNTDTHIHPQTYTHTYIHKHILINTKIHKNTKKKTNADTKHLRTSSVNSLPANTHPPSMLLIFFSHFEPPPSLPYVHQTLLEKLLICGDCPEPGINTRPGRQAFKEGFILNNSSCSQVDNSLGNKTIFLNQE